MMICNIIFSGLIGLVLGSFLNVVICRTPIILKNNWFKQCELFLNNKQINNPQFNLVIPNSHCINCNQALLWHDNIPLISFIILKTKCRFCKHSISWQYPIVEFLSFSLAILIYLLFGFSFLALALFLIAEILLALFFIDLNHLLLPDELTLLLLWIGLLFNTKDLFTTLNSAIYGAAIGYALFWLIGFIFKKIRKMEGIGQGDYKLFAALGAWFGWQSLPFILLLSSLIGLTVAFFLLLLKKINRETPLPFGCFLAMSAWLYIFVIWQKV